PDDEKHRLLHASTVERKPTGHQGALAWASTREVPVPDYDFNPPPGWPAPPAGWRPTPGWQPDPRWPVPPAGWPFWIERPPPRWRKPSFTMIGIAAAVAIVTVVGITAIRSSTSDRGITVPADADVPEFASIDDALVYYESEKSAAYDYVDAHPWGYDYTYLDT